jgi:hypothetical protein
MQLLSLLACMKLRSSQPSILWIGSDGQLLPPEVTFVGRRNDADVSTGAESADLNDNTNVEGIDPSSGGRPIRNDDGGVGKSAIRASGAVRRSRAESERQRKVSHVSFLTAVGRAPPDAPPSSPIASESTTQPPPSQSVNERRRRSGLANVQYTPAPNEASADGRLAVHSSPSPPATTGAGNRLRKLSHGTFFGVGKERCHSMQMILQNVLKDDGRGEQSASSAGDATAG